MDVMHSMTVFRRVVEAKSFSAVARESNMSQSTVSKHVAALEQRLNTKLLNRSTRSLKLTEAGEESIRVNGRFKASSPDAICDAAVEGLGIAIVCQWHAEKHIKTGALKVIMHDYQATAYDIHAVYPERRFMPQKVKRMIESLAQKIKEKRPQKHG